MKLNEVEKQDKKIKTNIVKDIDWENTRIPKESKRVYTGVLFDVYSWSQKLLNGSYKTYEAVKRLDAIQIISINENNEIILLKEEQPLRGKFMNIPSGYIEKNETPIQTVRREFSEELGMESNDIQFWKSINFGFEIDWTIHIFIAKNCHKNGQTSLSNGEIIEPITFNFEDFLEQTQKESFRNKAFSNIIFRIMHTPGKLEEFKNTLFNN